MAAGFAFSQVLLFVKAYPHAASQAGREAHKPCVRVVIGGAGLARHGMVQFFCAACGAVFHHFFKQRHHCPRRALADHVFGVRKILFQHVAFIVSHFADVARLNAQPIVGKDGVRGCLLRKA